MRSKLISLVLSVAICTSFPLMAQDQETWSQWALRNWKELSAAVGIGFIINKIARNLMAEKTQQQTVEATKSEGKPKEQSANPQGGTGRPEEGENDGNKPKSGKEEASLASDLVEVGLQSSVLSCSSLNSANDKIEQQIKAASARSSSGSNSGRIYAHSETDTGSGILDVLKEQRKQQEEEMMKREGTGQLMQSEGSASSGSLHAEQDEEATGLVIRMHAGIIGEQAQTEIKPDERIIREDLAKHIRSGSEQESK